MFGVAITALVAFLWYVLYESAQRAMASTYVLSLWEKCIFWPIASGMVLVTIGISVAMGGFWYMWLTR